MAGALTRMLGRATAAGGGTPGDGTQGSVNAGILAGVYFTQSGGTCTIVGQKNVASVTKLAANTYRVTFSSALAHANYGVLIGGRCADNINDMLMGGPSCDSTSSRNQYTTTELDIGFTSYFGSSQEPGYCGVVVYDPAAVGSDYLAAAYCTISGTTVTVVGQTNIGSVPYASTTGIYSPTYSSALADADYSIHGHSKWNAFGGTVVFVSGRNRNSTGPINRQTTALVDMSIAHYTSGGQFNPPSTSFLMANADVAPRGTLARVRFSYIGAAVSIIKSYNVSSVTRLAAGVFRITFTNALVDADYVAFCGGKLPDSAGANQPAAVSMNADVSSSRGLHSTTDLDITTAVPTSAISDAEYVDVWVLKPGMM